MESEIIKVHKRLGWGVPIAHTCKDGDFESTANCPACQWLREHNSPHVEKGEAVMGKSGREGAKASPSAFLGGEKMNTEIEDEWGRFGNMGIYLNLKDRYNKGMQFTSRQGVEDTVKFGMMGSTYYRRGTQLAIDKFWSETNPQEGDKENER